MSREITFEARVPVEAGSVLAHTMAILRAHRINPETLVWSSLPGSGVAKFWLMLTAPDARLAPLLVERFQRIPAVGNVRLIPSDDSLRNALPGSPDDSFVPQQALD